jgi:hypothetical protein
MLPMMLFAAVSEIFFWKSAAALSALVIRSITIYILSC